jgi:EsV-1-7 cysteine-rich motif
MCAHVQVNVASDKLMVAKKKSARSSSKQCKDPECTGTYASFGYTADRKRVRCGKHRLPGMVDLRMKQCEFPSCNDEAIFGRAYTNVSTSMTICTTWGASMLTRKPCSRIFEVDILLCLLT